MLDAGHYIRDAADPGRLAVFLLCGLALFWPSSTTFAVAWLAGVGGWLWVSPETTNHSFTTSVCSLLVLAAGAHKAEGGSKAAAQVALPLIAAVYAAAILQKANTTYLFDVESSCAVELTRQAWEAPDAIARLLPPISLVVEGAIGLGMLLPATRRWAAVGGALFHLALGMHPLSPIYLFSITMVALYASSWTISPSSLIPLVRVSALGAATAIALGWLGVRMPGVVLGWVSWLAVGVYMVGFFARYAPSPAPVWPSARPALSGLALLLPLLNCVPAFTGDRQYNSYDMYSNLEVEEGRSNHLFLPSFVGERPFARRVRITAAEPAGFAVPIQYRDQVAWVEVVRRLRKGDITRLSWEDESGAHTWRRGEPLPGAEISWWTAKTRRLRPLPESPGCTDCATCVRRGP
jgi:hypothetical protein